MASARACELFKSSCTTYMQLNTKVVYSFVHRVITHVSEIVMYMKEARSSEFEVG